MLPSTRRGDGAETYIVLVISVIFFMVTILSVGESAGKPRLAPGAYRSGFDERLDPIDVRIVRSDQVGSGDEPLLVSDELLSIFLRVEGSDLRTEVCGFRLWETTGEIPSCDPLHSAILTHGRSPSTSIVTSNGVQP